MGIIDKSTGDEHISNHVASSKQILNKLPKEVAADDMRLLWLGAVQGGKRNTAITRLIFAGWLPHNGSFAIRGCLTLMRTIPAKQEINFYNNTYWLTINLYLY